MSAQSRPQTLATVAAADRLPEVVVLSGLQDLRSRLEATCGTRARFVDADDDAAALARARIMVADPSAFVQVAERCTRLEWMQSTWAGADALLEHSKRDYTVTRLAGCFGPRIAECAPRHLSPTEAW
jgi:phosphoglycerate dehydrogenase-like enzyme